MFARLKKMYIVSFSNYSIGYHFLYLLPFSIKLGMGIKCFSCHTFAPIDSIFFGSPNSLYSVLPGFRLVEAQLPPIRDEALLPLLYPGMLTVGPERRPYSLLSIRRVPLPGL